MFSHHYVINKIIVNRFALHNLYHLAIITRKASVIQKNVKYVGKREKTELVHGNCNMNQIRPCYATLRRKGKLDFLQFRVCLVELQNCFVYTYFFIITHVEIFLEYHFFLDFFEYHKINIRIS